MASISAALISYLDQRGYRARVVSISRAAEIEELFSSLKQSGAIAPDFYPDIVKYLNFDFASILPEAKSIIIAASPQPLTRVDFAGKKAIIPPTYIYRDIWNGQLEAVRGFLEPRGFKVKRARLPLKTLAVRSGLARYGRNNIAYIEGMGSFHRLGAFYSDMPCGDETWGEPQSMGLCQTCKACIKACPTSAITADRFLIRAERCLTHFNESEKAMPDWVKPEWHNAMLGCMRCQEACPIDKPFLKQEREAEESFSAAETEQILAGIPKEKLPAATLAKLDALCLGDDDVYPLLRRNLALLLNR